MSGKVEDKSGGEPEETAKILSVIPKKLHKRAKMLALQQERPLSSVVQELLERWLLEQEGKGDER